MIWPVPTSKSRRLPSPGKPGGYLEQRGDRWHCGVDIYAPAGSKILAVEQGTIIEVSLFTSPKKVAYWNSTYQIILKGDSGYYYRYAELEKANVSTDDHVQSGQMIGVVGEVLNKEKIDERSPHYIQRLRNDQHLSMLHLEVYTERPVPHKRYLGGNWFDRFPPHHLVNPEKILPQEKD